MTPRDVARGLAWFGIGLGLAETFAPRQVARAIGLDEHAPLIQIFGLREIASGVIVLSADDPQSWLWTRVAGDALDGALLGSGLGRGNPQRARTLLALLTVAPVVVLDVFYSGR